MGEAILCFLPNDASDTAKQIYQTRLELRHLFLAMVERLKEKCIEADVPAEIEGKVLSPGLFLHQASKSDFNEVDILTIRVLTPNEVRHCYASLGVVHNNWKPVPGYIKDWIATPRNNGYSALHTSIRGPKELVVTVIIQTTEMRQRQLKLTSLDSNPYYQAMIRLEERQQLLGLSSVPIISQLSERRTITVLTLNEALLILDEDATVLDCAYRIHSEIFRHCQGAVVNGKTVHRGYPLKNLDRVEVLTASKVEPEPQWIPHITLPSAKKALGRLLRRREESEAEASGKIVVENYISAESLRTGEAPETIARTLRRKLGLQKTEDVYKGVGRGKYSLSPRPRSVIKSNVR